MSSRSIKVAKNSNGGLAVQPVESGLLLDMCCFQSLNIIQRCNLWLNLMKPIMGPESDHWECLSVTNWLTHCRLVNLIDVTLACEDGNSKLVEVVTVVEVDDEKRVDNSLVQIWKVNFGHKILWPVRFFVTLWFPTGSINWNLVSRSAFGDVKINWHILLPGPNPITHLLHTSYLISFNIMPTMLAHKSVCNMELFSCGAV